MAMTGMQEDYKGAWYDGWIFALSADLSMNLRLHLNQEVDRFIAPGKKILDIGCGTGSLVALLSRKSYFATGVDISPKMIRYAQDHFGTLPYTEFCLLKRREKISKRFWEKFDCAVLKMVLHEMSEEERIDLIGEAKKMTQELIIADWLALRPGSPSGIWPFAVERMTSNDHFRNFAGWCEAGGIDGFLERCSLKNAEEKLFLNKRGKIVRATW